MIIDEITQYKRYQAIEGIGIVLKEMYDLYQTGNFPTDNKELSTKIKVNRVSFQGRVAGGKNEFENHHQWVDIHFIFNGSEQILVSEADNMSITKEYDESKDIEFLEGMEHVSVNLKAGQFLICYPGEAHCVGVSGEVTKPILIEKLVGKINVAP